MNFNPANGRVRKDPTKAKPKPEYQYATRLPASREPYAPATDIPISPERGYRGEMLYRFWGRKGGSHGNNHDHG